MTDDTGSCDVRAGGGDDASLGHRVVARAIDAGFAAAGIATLEPSRWTSELRDWLSAGKHGTMAYLAEHEQLRTHPAELIHGARSAIMVADLYASRAANTDEPLRTGEGRIARYARGRDYHKVIKRRLHALADALNVEHPGHTFRAFVDTAPVLERELAARAGIGWTGKHTLTIHPRIGSYMLLGGIATTLRLDVPEGQRSIADHCGTCTRCIEACPTGAITPYSVDARRCISYLTIEHRAPIDERHFGEIGGWVFGCDICQQVCPHNSPRSAETLPAEGARISADYEPRRDRFDLLEVLGWNEDDRRGAFTTSSMKRATLAMMKRNALIAAGNTLRDHELTELRQRVEQIAVDDTEDELVRLTARVVLSRLGRGPE